MAEKRRNCWYRVQTQAEMAAPKDWLCRRMWSSVPSKRSAVQPHGPSFTNCMLCECDWLWPYEKDCAVRGKRRHGEISARCCAASRRQGCRKEPRRASACTDRRVVALAVHVNVHKVRAQNASAARQHHPGRAQVASPEPVNLDRRRRDAGQQDCGPGHHIPPFPRSGLTRAQSLMLPSGRQCSDSVPSTHTSTVAVSRFSRVLPICERGAGKGKRE